MSNTYFQFKQFTIQQDRCAMKVTTDGCLFGSSLPPVPSQGGGVVNVLDVGTGTGLLALMYAQKNPGAIIDAIEIDKEAADQAIENVQASPWSTRIKIIHTDARTFHFSKKYDLIISNPPFYEKELRSTNSQKNIAYHSEELSLQELLTIIKNYLKPGGQFFLLFPDKRSANAVNLIKKKDFEITYMTMIRQSVNHNVFRIIIRGGHKSNSNESCPQDEISVWDEDQQYTSEFKELLKNYYLYL